MPKTVNGRDRASFPPSSKTPLVCLFDLTLPWYRLGGPTSPPPVPDCLRVIGYAPPRPIPPSRALFWHFGTAAPLTQHNPSVLSPLRSKPILRGARDAVRCGWPAPAPRALPLATSHCLCPHPLSRVVLGTVPPPSHLTLTRQSSVLTAPRPVAVPPRWPASRRRCSASRCPTTR